MAKQTLQDIEDRMTKAETIEDGAIVYIKSVPQLIKDAIAQAQENGATAEELVPLTDLSVSLDAKSDALQEALTAGT
jgi:cell division ATPase FtsA